jgi:hypothetical protein
VIINLFIFHFVALTFEIQGFLLLAQLLLELFFGLEHQFEELLLEDVDDVEDHVNLFILVIIDLV